MRSKVVLSILVIALAAALIAGGTGAWFTGEADLAEAEFTAGTVAVNADGPDVTPMDGRYVDNVNPGDCATVCWDIVNEGTKRAELRVKIDSSWVDSNLSLDGVVYYAPKPGSDWVMYEDNDGMWLYYTGGPVDGTYDGAEGETVPLCLVIGFDGPNMDNDYQGIGYTISGEVEAVQATNGAPEAEWGAAFTNAKNGEGLYTDSIEYFANGDMPCWNGNEEELLVVTSIAVEGPDTITKKILSAAYANYEAIVYDQYGIEMPNQSVTWSIASDKNGVSINQNGRLSVTSGASTGEITVVATVENVYGEKIVMIKKCSICN